MKILVVSRNYHPELTGIGPYTTELCEYLAQNGADVTVITSFPYYPHWYIPKEYKGKWILKEERNGVDILRTYIHISQRKGLRQLFHEFCLPVTSLFASFQLDQDYDLILSNSPPLTLGLTAYFLSRTQGIPFVLYIHDLLPDTAVNLGMLQEGKVVQMLYRLERFIYDKAEAIGVISPGFAENLYAKGVPKSKVHYLPDWIDLDFIKPLKRDDIFRKQNRISKEQFLVMYAGNIGNKQGLETLLNTAELLREYENILFLIVGEGSRKSALVEKAKVMDLPNLRFLTLQPKKILPYMLSASDLLVITQQAGVTDICLPCKLLTYMASATPVVASVNSRSEAAKVIKQAQSGLLVKPEEPQALKDAILRLYKSKELRVQYGNNGRSFISEYFEKTTILRRFWHFLYDIAHNQ